MRKILLSLLVAMALPAFLFAQTLISQEYHENGNLATAVYQSDDEVLIVKYYEDGTVQEKAVYIDNKRNGVYQTWHQNGQKHIVAVFVDDVMNGSFRLWDDEGNLTGTAKFKDGKVIKGNIKDSDGVIVAIR